MPVYNGAPIWGYLQHAEGLVTKSYDFEPSQPLVRIISDSAGIGASWTVYHVTSHQYNYATIVAKDTTVIISGKSYYPTIVLRYTSETVGQPYPPVPYEREYYTKDIGLVKQEVLDYTGAVVSEKHLVDYFINK